MHRNARPRLEAQAQRPLGLDTVDVDHGAAGNDAQIAGLSGGVGQRLQDGVTRAAPGGHVQGVQGHAHQPVAFDDLAAEHVAFQKAELLEGRGYPVGGGFGHVQQSGKLADGRGPRVVRHRFQDCQSLCHHPDTVPRRVAPSPAAVPTGIVAEWRWPGIL